MTSVRAYRNSQRKPNYWFHTLLFRRLLQYEQPADWFEYVEMCGWTRARAQARAGDSVRIAGYLGAADKFDVALVKFATRYAD